MDEEDNIPHLEHIDGSEIMAEIDDTAIGLDGVFRPILIAGDSGEMTIDISLADAKRLFQFLDGAIVYLEERMQ